MTINIHPVLVHFPVAFLTIYALAEIARFKKLLDQLYWFYVKAFLSIFGSLASGATYLSGEMAEHLVAGTDKNLKHLIEVHSTFAMLTVIIFAILAVSYLVEWIHRLCPNWLQNSALAGVWNFVLKIKSFVLSGSVAVLLALAGLISVTITGALGGSIVYGPQIDPFVNFIYSVIIGK